MSSVAVGPAAAVSAQPSPQPAQSSTLFLPSNPPLPTSLMLFSSCGHIGGQAAREQLDIGFLGCVLGRVFIGGRREMCVV